MVQLRGRTRNALQCGSPVFSSPTTSHFSTQLLGNQLAAVANTQNRNAQFINLRVEKRRAFNMNACRATRQDDADWLTLAHFFSRNAMRHDF